MKFPHLEAAASAPYPMYRSAIRTTINTVFLIVCVAALTVAVSAQMQKKSRSESARPSTTTYTVASTPFNFEDISGTGNRIELSDDEVYGPVNFGFNFQFYDTTYNELYISSNGFVTFLPGQDTGCCDGQTLPTAGGPEGLIAGAWNDIYPPGAPTLSDGIFYQTLGTPGSRVFIVEYKNLPNCCNGGGDDFPIRPAGGVGDYTFQIKIFEGTNNIEVHYVNANTDGSQITAGVENQSGSVGTTFFQSSSNMVGNSAVQYVLGSTTAGEVTVGGRVMNSSGRGIKNVAVTLGGGMLSAPRTVFTGSFGYYSFDGLDAGQSYFVTVRSKRFSFTPSTLLVNAGEDVLNTDFVSLQ